MATHTPIINGMVFLLRFSPIRDSRGAYMGEMVDKETDEQVFVDVFPSYADAYRELRKMDEGAWDGSPAYAPVQRKTPPPKGQGRFGQAGSLIASYQSAPQSSQMSP